MIKLLVFAAMLLSALMAFSSPNDAPDTIYVNGDIYTQATPARAQALAVRGGRIVAIGTNDDIRKLKGAHTQVVELGGQFVMPGFNDAHCHLQSAGFEQMGVNLVGGKSLAEMQQRIAEHAKAAVPGDWIVGDGWDHTLWPGQKLPTRQDLDAVTNGHPAIFVRVDGHIAVANSAALQAAGITPQTTPPQGGAIDHDAQGQPTGIIRESAQGLISPRCRHLLRRSADVPLSWRWPMPRAGASRRRRTIRTGSNFWFTRRWSAMAS